MALTHIVTNFTGFAPLGTVLVAMLDIGVAEGTGLIARPCACWCSRRPAAC